MTYRDRCRRRRHGFTLLELLVVMFILVLLASAVTVYATRRVEEAKTTRATMDVEQLNAAIDTYYLQNGSYPGALEDLSVKPSGQELPQWNGPYIRKAVSSDPWNRPYVYVTPGQHNPDSFDLYSLGKDGKEGGTGSDQDITNW
jgi:general secretion pathway protein G